jgi:hypothetical protein
MGHLHRFFKELIYTPSCPAVSLTLLARCRSRVVRYPFFRGSKLRNARSTKEVFHMTCPSLLFG